MVLANLSIFRFTGSLWKSSSAKLAKWELFEISAIDILITFFLIYCKKKVAEESGGCGKKKRLKNQITGSLKLYIYCSLLKIRVLYYPRNILIARKKCLHRKVKKWQLNLKEEQIYSSINSNYNHKKTIKQFFKMYNMLHL